MMYDAYGKLIPTTQQENNLWTIQIQKQQQPTEDEGIYWSEYKRNYENTIKKKIEYERE